MTASGQAPPKADPRNPDNDNRVSEDELQAYVDGQLPAGERKRIEGHLAAHPRESERLEAYRKQNIGLHALFDYPQYDSQDNDPSLADLPPDMAAIARQLDREIILSTRPMSQFRNLAAGVALLVAASGAGWIAYERFSEPSDPLVAFTRQAAEAHARLAGYQATGSGAAGERGRQVVTWLSEQPEGAPLRLPDLESLGFRLVADRVLPPAAGGRAAQLLYKDKEGELITLYMHAGYRRAGREPVETSFTFRREGQVSQFFWQNGRFAYSLIGMMEQNRLLEIAEVISEELQREAREVGGAAGLSGGNAEASSPITFPGNADGRGAGQTMTGAPDNAMPLNAAEPGSEPMPAKPELLPLQPLPAPLPEPGSSPKDT